MAYIVDYRGVGEFDGIFDEIVRRAKNLIGGATRTAEEARKAAEKLITNVGKVSEELAKRKISSVAGIINAPESVVDFMSQAISNPEGQGLLSTLFNGLRTVGVLITPPHLMLIGIGGIILYKLGQKIFAAKKGSKLPEGAQPLSEEELAALKAQAGILDGATGTTTEKKGMPGWVLPVTIGVGSVVLLAVFLQFRRRK